MLDWLSEDLPLGVVGLSGVGTRATSQAEFLNSWVLLVLDTSSVGVDVYSSRNFFKIKKITEDHPIISFQMLTPLHTLARFC
jgi:hypothetical protein